MTEPHSWLEHLAAANHDHDSVLALTRTLVTIPSRGGIDPYDGVLDTVRTWLAERGLDTKTLTGPAGAPVGLTCEIRGAHPGPRWVLDACLDTAPFGDETAWTYPPTAATLADGWLHGRGAADSKVGAAIFCHLAARIAAVAESLHGTLVLLFDVDEHTGGFGGAKAYFEGPHAPDDVAGVMIGYPGLDKVVIGGRGVYRTRLHVHGVSAHSGSSSTASVSAIEKAAHLVTTLSATELPDGASAAFPLPGKVTVTAIEGGQGFSVTPDLCVLNVDIRTTPTFDTATAETLLRDRVTHADHAWPDTPATDSRPDTAWPAYALDDHSPLRTALLDAAHTAGLQPVAKIAGPSNIGNYLSGLGIPATAGFGVTYTGLHATDERIQIDTIPTVQAIYHTAVHALLSK
ncbi:M20 family metallopeptidase [Amycolatopsis samaneae]|uniref:M20 family metallopeptidase n=1 Tax=Amycolatopsis samaneae TaxID=664691 RepID=A0ABW5GKK6_9PSEU